MFAFLWCLLLSSSISRKSESNNVKKLKKSKKFKEDIFLALTSKLFDLTKKENRFKSISWISKQDKANFINRFFITIKVNQIFEYYI
jgi:hypothetical protein